MRLIPRSVEHFVNKNVGILLSTIALIIVISLILFAAPFSEFGDEGNIVKPAYSLAPSFDFSSRPVETTLYVYDVARRYQYVTDGHSITFRFPASYYRLNVNVKGGAQLKIVLYVDYRDFSPIRTRIRKLERFPITKEMNIERRELYTHLAVIEVSSNYFPNPTIILHKINNEVVVKGEYCELRLIQFGVPSVYHTNKLLGYPFSVSENFVSKEVINTNNGKEYSFQARCSRVINSAYCAAYTYFMGRSVFFEFPKKISVIGGKKLRGSRSSWVRMWLIKIKRIWYSIQVDIAMKKAG